MTIARELLGGHEWGAFGTGPARAGIVNACRETREPPIGTRFADARTTPFFDLLALVERREAMRVADLGCGTGKLTAVWAEAHGEPAPPRVRW